MSSRRLTIGLLAFVLWAAPARASQITVTDLYDWSGQTNSSGVTYQTFAESSPPQWTHTLLFAPPAASFDSADVELSFGGTRNTGQEVWLLWDTGSTLLGQLTSTGNNSADTIIQQTFAIPLSLWPVLPTGSWTLALRLTETKSQLNSIFMDYSRLTVTYQDGVTDPGTPAPEPVPEPATLTLLGLGIAGASLRKWRTRAA